MKEKPVKVRLIGTEKSNYKIKFPYLDVPVIVNEYYYKKMRSSEDFLFTNDVESHSFAQPNS